MQQFLKSIVVIFCLSAVQAKAIDEQASDEVAWNVFGNDDRKPMTSHKYPWSTIGYLSNGCTATLVSRDVILTAAHCLYDSTTFELRTWIVFTPNRIYKKSRDKTYKLLQVWTGAEQLGYKSREDWAFAKLESPIGDKYGWMGVTVKNRDTVTLAGYASNYHNGETASVHVGCKVRRRLNGLFFHDCDMGRGASGGPVFFIEEEKAFIIGVNIAEYRDKSEASLPVPEYEEKHANIAVPTSTFMEKLRAVIEPDKKVAAAEPRRAHPRDSVLETFLPRR
jgi:protease YdgD